MSINTFKLDGIDAILNKHLQPWADSNNRPDSSYRELLSKTPEIPMPEELGFRLSYERHFLFTYRVRYYCRLTDYAVADHLRQAFSTIDSDQSEYTTAYLLKLTREAVTTLIADAVNHCKSLNVTTESLTDFNNKRQEKECFVILHYVIASLVHCWMEMQQRYQYVCDLSDLQDVASFYASIVGWINDPTVYVESISQESKGEKKPCKITTCSFNYINSDEQERNRCLTEFHAKLIKYGQIPENTDLRHVLAVFSGRPTAATVEWIGKKHILKFIIVKLKEKNVLAVYPAEPNYTHWYVVSCRFKYRGDAMPNISSESWRKGDESVINDIVNTLC